MDQKKPLYSYHIFLFPFKWKMDAKKSNRKNLDEVSDLLQKNNKWNRQTHNNELPDAETYDEFMYFHPFAQEALYDRANNDNIRQFSYTLVDETRVKNNHSNGQLFYYIKLLGNKEYVLNIDKIHLNVYGTGIGVLSFHLANYHDGKEYDFSDILNINNFGRRIYPPVLDYDENGAISSFKAKHYSWH